jgi:hypothetical protein
MRVCWHTSARPRALATLLACALAGCATHQDGEADEAVSSSEQSDLDAGGDASSHSDAALQRPDAIVSHADAGCAREELVRALTLQAAAPFDVLIVADHSDSLSWSREALVTGLRDLLVRVRGRSARFFVLTPTQYGASSAAAREPLIGTELVSWRDPVSGQAYQGEATEYVQQCADPDGGMLACPAPPTRVPHLIHGRWELRLPPPSAQITPAQTDAEFGAQQEAVAQAILRLPAGGSAHEQPLCTLARYLALPRAELPSNVLMLVLSDEDDTSTPRECVTALEAGVRSTKTQIRRPCSQDCSALAYQMTAPFSMRRLDATCVYADDRGVLHPELSQQTNLNLPATGCPVTSVLACSDDERSQVAQRCPANYKLQSCQGSCSTRTDARQCNLDLPTSVTNACSAAFEVQGKRYANLLDFCQRERDMNTPWQGCTAQGTKLEDFESLSGFQNLTPIMPGVTTTELVDHVKRSAQAIFGESGHRFEVIGFDPSFRCAPQPGQSHAENLRRLLRSSADLFPICESYAPALSAVGAFAETLVAHELPLELQAGEQLASAIVVDAAGAERLLSASAFRYDAAGRRLVFVPGTLTAQDRSLKLTLIRSCPMIVR